MNRAIELEPNIGVARINRAQAYAEKGEWKLALKDLDMIMAPNSQSGLPEWVALRGFARAALGDGKSAVADLEYALQARWDYIGLLTDPEYHSTFSTGEEYRSEAERDEREKAAYLEAAIADLKKKQIRGKKRK